MGIFRGEPFFFNDDSEIIFNSDFELLLFKGYDSPEVRAE
jgi:hypothetical protein